MQMRKSGLRHLIQSRFGAASALQFQLQAAGITISYHILLMLPYVFTLAVLAVTSRDARGPAALAQRRSGGAAAD